jgi:metal-responsive CopG/Arc/MetJ family transcriptional regulator
MAKTERSDIHNNSIFDVTELNKLPNQINIPKSKKKLLQTRKNKKNELQKNYHMQTICFTAQNYHKDIITQLLLSRLYMSKSELIRIASRSLLVKLYTNSNILIYENIWQDYRLQKNEFSQITVKMPVKLLACIDKVTQIESRSAFIRIALNQFIQTIKTITPENKTNPSKLYIVIAFRFLSTQFEQSKNLCQNGFYPSLSEITRIAIIDFLIDMFEYNQNNYNYNYSISVLEQEYLLINKTNKYNTVYAKISILLVQIMDEAIIKNPHLRNRSSFIRLAISKFLEKDSQIYANILNK